MPSRELQKLFSHHLGNHRRTSVAQALTFPGLSIDNVGSTSQGTAGGVLRQIGSGGPGSVDSQVASLGKQLSDLTTSQQAQLDKLNENTQALQQSNASRSSGRSVNGGLFGDLASSLFGNVLGIAPIVKGLFDLFGGSDNQSLQPLTPFSLPGLIQYQGALDGATGTISTVDYGQGGKGRTVSSGSRTAQTTTAVTIQVNAMDTQSFLDRSDDIARAVRQALLNSNSLNDVIADL